MKYLWRRFLNTMVVTLSVSVSTAASAYSHDLIMEGRSVWDRYFYISQCVEGEWGNVETTADGIESDAIWKGYGFRTGMGIELLRFIQMGVSHTFTNLKARENANERLDGSKLQGQMKLVFAAPVVNLELGAGMTGAQVSYQHGLEHTTLGGSGMYYNIGVQYFTSHQVSFFSEVRQNNEHYFRTAGSKSVKEVQVNTQNFGAGFNVWL